MNIYIPACFLVNKGATPANDQSITAGASPTQITFGTEVYDVGALFASDVWTPPAGRIIIRATAQLTGTISAGVGSIILYKNGATWVSRQCRNVANAAYHFIQAEDAANGTDTYGVAVLQAAGTSLKVIAGSATIFSGHWISP